MLNIMICFQPLLILLLLSAPPVMADDLPSMPGSEIKCGDCPCVNPCSQELRPPPPPPPKSSAPCTPLSLAPPPPRFIYVTAAPPPPRFIYVTGVPGQLYTTDADNWGFYSVASRNTLVPKWLFWSSGLLILFLVCGGIVFI